jgi:hypothetical protein
MVIVAKWEQIIEEKWKERSLETRRENESEG